MTFERLTLFECGLHSRERHLKARAPLKNDLKKMQPFKSYRTRATSKNEQYITFCLILVQPATILRELCGEL
jgi:hypothetical protein